MKCQSLILHGMQNIGSAVESLSWLSTRATDIINIRLKALLRIINQSEKYRKHQNIKSMRNKANKQIYMQANVSLVKKQTLKENIALSAMVPSSCCVNRSQRGFWNGGYLLASKLKYKYNGDQVAFHLRPAHGLFHCWLSKLKSHSNIVCHSEVPHSCLM